MNRRGKYARLPLLVAVLLLLALIPFALFRGSQAPEAEAAWWDNSWRYRKSIQVTNNTSQQSNVYISLTLDTSDTTKFQDDCGDLRFTKQNGQLLPYYIVSGCGTVSTGVHVQLDTFPAGAQTLYAYYGNPSAPNAFANNNFLMEATNYSVGGTGSEETAPGPVAYWKFDEGSGSTAHDSAGDNHGMVNGATWAGEGQCVNSDCLSFTNGPYVSTSPNSLANAQQAFSVSVWIKPQLETPTGSDRYGYIVTKGSLFGGGGFKLYQQENQQIGFYAGWSSGYTPEREIRTTFEDVDKWYQVVAVFNGESQSLYIDGELKAQNSVPNRFLGNTEPIAIGGWSNNYRPFHGLIDEVKIFPYALTEDEIKAEYNLGVAAVIGTGPAAPPPVGGNLDDSLVAHWAFDEQYGQTAHDKVGNNHGTFGADTNSGNDDPTWKPAGECKVNGCLGFDGSNDYLPLGSDPSLDIDNMTISAWVYPN